MHAVERMATAMGASLQDLVERAEEKVPLAKQFFLAAQ